MKYRQCTRCLMDTDEDPKIKFDSNGVCDFCRNAEKRIGVEYFPNEEGEKLLTSIISEIKANCKDDEYDCLVGVSGGIDSSYILYKCHQLGLRMLAVHIDDGLDNPIAVENLKKLSEHTNTKIISIKPYREEYADLIYSLLKASVSNLAIAQDNLIVKALQDYAEQNSIKYILDGSNFAHECILGRKYSVNSCDKKYILGIQKKFGRVKLEHLHFMSLRDRYIKRHKKSNPKHIRPLNLMNYNISNAIDELRNFCGFEYYGGKHYESILTRFMQCYYLPIKFKIDKRKAHYSSLIVSGQITREEGLHQLSMPLYKDEKTLENDMAFLASYMGISLEELKRCIALPPVPDNKYRHSILNELAPIARKFRRILE